MYYTVGMVTESEEQTIEFAAQYARTLQKGDVFFRLSNAKMMLRLIFIIGCV